MVKQREMIPSGKTWKRPYAASRRALASFALVADRVEGRIAMVDGVDLVVRSGSPGPLCSMIGQG